MPRLFTAVGLPDEVIAAFSGILPAAAKGMRLAGSQQMHLTLVFIGEADLITVANALSRVRIPPFPLSISGTGRFRSARKGGTTLWAAVRPSAALSSLHRAIAASLDQAGITTDDRVYLPHITLARCKRGVPSGILRDFLSAGERFQIPEFVVTSFGLYSSTTHEAGPVYRKEFEFPLNADAVQQAM